MACVKRSAASARLLAMAVSRRKSCAWKPPRALGVEVRKEGIVLVFEDQRRVETRREPLGERRVADAGRALDSDVPNGWSVAKYSLIRAVRPGYQRLSTGAPMRTDRLELRLLRLPLVRISRPASGGRTGARSCSSAVSRRLNGLGECVADADPFYSGETTETCWQSSSGYLAPRVLGSRFGCAARSGRRCDRPRPPHGEGGSRDGRVGSPRTPQGQPLSALLGGVRAAMPSGVSIGIEASVDALLERIDDGAGRRLPARQDQDQAWLGRRRRSSACATASATICR